MLVSFELTMPKVNSWNGKWSGEDKKFYHIRNVDKKTGEKLMQDAVSYPLYKGLFEREKVGETSPQKKYYYNFGDGWGANITAEVVTAKEASKRRKASSGFCGYEWMVDSIILYNEILNSSERKALKTCP